MTRRTKHNVPQVIAAIVVALMYRRRSKYKIGRETCVTDVTDYITRPTIYFKGEGRTYRILV